MIIIHVRQLYDSVQRGINSSCRKRCFVCCMADACVLSLGQFDSLSKIIGWFRAPKENEISFSHIIIDRNRHLYCGVLVKTISNTRYLPTTFTFIHSLVLAVSVRFSLVISVTFSFHSYIHSLLSFCLLQSTRS